MLIKQSQKLLIFIFLFLIIIFPNLRSEKIAVPGNPVLLSRYINFYYNLPTKDFLYHLNDLLLFSEAPSDSLIKNGIRKKILNIILMENKIDQLIKKRFRYDKNMFTINITKRKGYRNGIKLLNYLGLNMEETVKGLKIEEDNSSGIVDYHRFINLKISAMQKQVNKTMRIFYRHITSEVPFELNIDFLRKVTGLPLSGGNFLQYMVKNKKFSLFLAILYRLSDREIDFISSLKTKKIPNPWRTIYSDKKFLMGIFNLSNALRVKYGRIVLPGGKQATEFWSKISRSPFPTDQFSFLKSIATSMDGKLNYLFSNTYFIPNKKLKLLFFNFDVIKTKKILSLINLSKNEKLAPNRFPRLRRQGYFKLIYALEEREGSI